jgi:hypothetical protein
VVESAQLSSKLDEKTSYADIWGEIESNEHPVESAVSDPRSSKLFSRRVHKRSILVTFRSSTFFEMIRTIDELFFRKIKVNNLGDGIRKHPSYQYIKKILLLNYFYPYFTFETLICAVGNCRLRSEVNSYHLYFHSYLHDEGLLRPSRYVQNPPFEPLLW